MQISDIVDLYEFGEAIADSLDKAERGIVLHISVVPHRLSAT